MSVRIVALASLLGIVACDNRDARLERDARALCDTIQLGTTTLREASRSIGDRPVFVSCRGDLEPIDGQVCTPGASVCQLRWQFPSNDCGAGGCTFVCDVRTNDLSNGADPSPDTAICAKRFLKQQPLIF